LLLRLRLRFYVYRLFVFPFTVVFYVYVLRCCCVYFRLRSFVGRLLLRFVAVTVLFVPRLLRWLVVPRFTRCCYVGCWLFTFGFYRYTVYTVAFTRSGLFAVWLVWFFRCTFVLRFVCCWVVTFGLVAFGCSFSRLRCWFVDLLLFCTFVVDTFVVTLPVVWLLRLRYLHVCLRYVVTLRVAVSHVVGYIYVVVIPVYVYGCFGCRFWLRLPC